MHSPDRPGTMSFQQPAGIVRVRLTGQKVCYCLQHGTDYPENDIRIVEATQSAEDCQIECQAEPLCNFFVYASNEKCFLKNAKNSIGNPKDVTFGPKNC